MTRLAARSGRRRELGRGTPDVAGGRTRLATGPGWEGRRVGLLAAMILTAAPAAAGEPPEMAYRRGVDCAYHPATDPVGAEEPGPLVGVALPDPDLFRPPLADMKEPRFYASWRRVRFRGAAAPGEGGRKIKAGVVGFGGDFGLWGLRQPHGCDGLQVNLAGAVFSQFNLDAPSSDLINSDFIAGLPIEGRRGRFSSRLRLYHQSSHLGDEFLLNNPKVERLDLSFEAVDLLLSVEGRWWRLYGGGGYLLSPNPALDRGLAQWGVEFRGPTWRSVGKTTMLPVFGTDFQSFEERDWTVTTSMTGGVELVSPGGSRRVRLLAAYLRGFAPFGQFFNTEKMENFGLQLQFEF